MYVAGKKQCPTHLRDPENVPKKCKPCKKKKTVAKREACQRKGCENIGCTHCDFGVCLGDCPVRASQPPNLELFNKLVGLHSNSKIKLK